MSRNKPNKTLTYLTDQIFLYYDEKSNHVMISADENADYIHFEGKPIKTETWYPYQDMPKHSLHFIFSTNGYGFNHDQQNVIIDIKELLMSKATLNQAPILISEEYLFKLIDAFQLSLTSEQINALITKPKNQNNTI